ncbi:MAG: right-handed parallel beta-helix repeat-containing protein [Phycisphaerales bacterium]|nr:right-handed parallel beta-helix repeat-containing protein [Phycisphaerales bacterium]
MTSRARFGRARFGSALALVAIAGLAIATHAQPFDLPKTGGGADAKPAGERPVIVVDRDNVVIDRSCTVKINPGVVIKDADGNGVVHIKASNISVEFAGDAVLRGAEERFPHEQMTGTGVRIDGQSNVQIRSLRASGFKVALHATNASGLVIEGGDFSDLFRHRLFSDVAKEDQRDWLWPHRNDQNEWLTNYGAAVYVEDSKNVSISNIRVRTGQNGIILDRCTNAKVFNNDCSYLSGWGLALWRSSGNTIARNAFDFCIRGYEHGVYNRGQDSAGILLFEQCSNNVIAQNSATHCGDGLFVFAGKEALGEVLPANAATDAKKFERLGCNDNLIIENDFSYAAAHGVEITFSFNNRLINNTMVENAICGFWGGYSQQTLLMGNTITHNGTTGAREGGGVNIEHGFQNTLVNNTFGENTVAISLWDDDDTKILQTPWAKANHRGSRDNRLIGNTFNADKIGVVLNRTQNTLITHGSVTEVVQMLKRDEASTIVEPDADAPAAEFETPVVPILPGVKPDAEQRQSRPRGRQYIVMTSSGPWDFMSPAVRLGERRDDRHVYEVYQLPGFAEVNVDTLPWAVPTDRKLARTHRVKGELKYAEGEQMYQPLTVTAEGDGVFPYSVSITHKEFSHSARGTIVRASWKTRFFTLDADPLTDANAFERGASQPPVNVDAAAASQPVQTDDEAPVKPIAPGAPVEVTLPALAMRFGNEGPSQLNLHSDVSRAAYPREMFGFRATTKLPMLPGEYDFAARADDGVRIAARRADEPNAPFVTILENWKRAVPTTTSGRLKVEPEANIKPSERRPVVMEIRVDYFELSGWAEFGLTIEPISPEATKP